MPVTALAPTSASQKLGHLNAALEHICFRLQLPDDQFRLAQKKHEQVGAWLIREGSTVRQYSPLVYHQGSMRIETTVLPLHRTEHDLDAVCQIDAPNTLSPRRVYELIWGQLAANPEYKPILKTKPRCLRLNFPNKFHVDVVPAIGAGSGTGIFIPDMPDTVGKWKPSDPKGFAGWFGEMCKKVKPRILKASYARNMSEGYVDPMPDPEPFHRKKPLRRAVQLLKRWRDVQFHGREGLATPSILVTKLAGDFYDGEPEPYDAVRIIVDAMHDYFAGGCPVVRNPVNHDEVISEKWHEKPETFLAFKAAVADLRERWRRLPDLKGAHVVARELEALFADPAAEAVREAFGEIESARSRSGLAVSRETRTLVPAAAAVPAAIKVQDHTFYGR